MLRSIKVDFTNLCNASCPFCPYHGTSGSVTVQGKRQIEPRSSLSLFDMERLADGLDEIGLRPVIKFSGRGEATTNLEFSPVVRLLRGREFPVRLITNGLLLRQHAPLLAENAVEVIVSIHGTAQVHDAVIGRKDALVLAQRGIRNLLDNGNSPQIAIILTVDTANDLPELIAEYAAHGLRVRVHHNFDQAARSLLDPGTVQSLRTEIKERYPDVTWVPELSEPAIHAYYGPEPYVLAPHHCSRYQDEIEVWSDGSVTVCDSKSFGNIRDDSITTIMASGVRAGFLKTVDQELKRTQGLDPTRCDRCCYQQAPAD